MEMDINTSNAGIQIVVAANRIIPDRNQSILPGDPLWNFCCEIVKKEFYNVKEIKRMEFVRVDLTQYQIQYSFKKKQK